MAVPLLIPTHRLSLDDLGPFRGNPFDAMIKFVADVSSQRIALGGEMHADAEQALLDSGSHQGDVWGGNLWPWDVPPRIEYISLINIRPSLGNRSMAIQSEETRHQVDDIVQRWLDIGWEPPEKGPDDN